MARPAHIVAVSAKTAVGVTAEGSAAAVRARVSRLMEHPFMIDASGDKLRAARDCTIAANLMGHQRLLALSQSPLAQLTTKLTRSQSLPALNMVLALAEPRPGHSRSDAESLVRAHTSLEYPGIGRLVVQLEGEGHAGALYALERAVEAVEGGLLEICVAGGVDSYLHADTLDWLEQERRIARAGSPGGLPPGEGAGFVAVASDDMRRRLGLQSLARFRGIASTREARMIVSDEGLLGEALSAALLEAAGQARRTAATGELIDAIFCDINGERWRTDDWGFSMLRTSQLFRDATVYVTGVSEWGDVGAASGALACVLAVQSWQRRYAHGPSAMIWGSSWSGLRVAAVLEHESG